MGGLVRHWVSSLRTVVRNPAGIGGGVGSSQRRQTYLEKDDMAPGREERMADSACLVSDGVSLTPSNGACLSHKSLNYSLSVPWMFWKV